jgi:hypothetical protein
LGKCAKNFAFAGILGNFLHGFGSGFAIGCTLTRVAWVEAFFTARLSGRPMNSVPHLHSFRIKVSPSGVVTFLTGRKLGKNGLLVGMGS